MTLFEKPKSRRSFNDWRDAWRPWPSWDGSTGFWLVLAVEGPSPDEGRISFHLRWAGKEREKAEAYAAKSHQTQFVCYVDSITRRLRPQPKLSELVKLHDTSGGKARP